MKTAKVCPHFEISKMFGGARVRWLVLRAFLATAAQGRGAVGGTVTPDCRDGMVILRITKYYLVGRPWAAPLLLQQERWEMGLSGEAALGKKQGDLGEGCTMPTSIRIVGSERQGCLLLRWQT